MQTGQSQNPQPQEITRDAKDCREVLAGYQERAQQLQQNFNLQQAFLLLDAVWQYLSKAPSNSDAKQQQQAQGQLVTIFLNDVARAKADAKRRESDSKHSSKESANLENIQRALEKLKSTLISLIHQDESLSVFQQTISSAFELANQNLKNFFRKEVSPLLEVTYPAEHTIQQFKLSVQPFLPATADLVCYHPDVNAIIAELVGLNVEPDDKEKHQLRAEIQEKIREKFPEKPARQLQSKKYRQRGDRWGLLLLTVSFVASILILSGWLNKRIQQAGGDAIDEGDNFLEQIIDIARASGFAAGLSYGLLGAVIGVLISRFFDNRNNQRSQLTTEALDHDQQQRNLQRDREQYHEKLLMELVGKLRFVELSGLKNRSWQQTSFAKLFSPQTIETKVCGIQDLTTFFGLIDVLFNHRYGYYAIVPFILYVRAQKDLPQSVEALPEQINHLFHFNEEKIWKNLLNSSSQFSISNYDQLGFSPAAPVAVGAPPHASAVALPGARRSFGLGDDGDHESRAIQFSDSQNRLSLFVLLYALHRLYAELNHQQKIGSYRIAPLEILKTIILQLIAHDNEDLDLLTAVVNYDLCFFEDDEKTLPVIRALQKENSALSTLSTLVSKHSPNLFSAVCEKLKGKEVDLLQSVGASVDKPEEIEESASQFSVAAIANVVGQGEFYETAQPTSPSF